METLKKIYVAVASLLGRIAVDKLLHFICGMFITAIFIIAIPCTAMFAVVFAAVAGVLKEWLDHYLYKGWNWFDILATVLGGLAIQILAWL